MDLSRERVRELALKLSGWALNAEVDGYINQWLDVDAALRERLASVERERDEQCAAKMEFWRVLEAIREDREQLRAQVTQLQGEVDGLRGFKRSVDEALNSGDGSYRP